MALSCYHWLCVEKHGCSFIKKSIELYMKYIIKQPVSFELPFPLQSRKHKKPPEDCGSSQNFKLIFSTIRHKVFVPFVEFQLNKFHLIIFLTSFLSMLPIENFH